MGRTWKRKQRAEDIQEGKEVSMRPDAEATKEERRRERRPPLLAVTFVRKAANSDSPIGIEELCNRIYGGVFMNPNKLKFWVDQDLEKHCFLLLAQELSITGINNERYWGWIDQKEKCRGWHAPVNLNLALLDGTTQGRIENLEEKRKGEWINILVGTFMTNPKNVGEINFRLVCA
ncbi:lectin-like [Eucalyptus grandis]|uniref:lectin-like n=1 Tax=Eucalyptus grandis TaxID=71139 RepID=UPI00192EA8C6|nr:lectin-like [Eucalyptus grandis]